MGIEALSRKLTREEIDFRVGSVFTGKNDVVWATILAYKDARVDMKVLDEAVGVTGWQTKYDRDHKGVLFCGIGIKHEGEWVWKYSNGTESNTEAEKGEASDAFKRAGFMWGIGRHLYDAGEIMIKLAEGEYTIENGRAKATKRLRPNDWAWIVEDGVVIKAMDKNAVRWTNPEYKSVM